MRRFLAWLYLRIAARLLGVSIKRGLLMEKIRIESASPKLLIDSIGLHVAAGYKLIRAGYSGTPTLYWSEFGFNAEEMTDADVAAVVARVHAEADRLAGASGAVKKGS